MNSLLKAYICRTKMQGFFNYLYFPDEKYETLIVDSGYKVYMKLHIRNVTRRDFTEYKCVAKNSLGSSDGSISLYGKITIDSLILSM